jgi:hypothetical protein
LEAEPSEVVTDSCPWRRSGRRTNPHCCKPLRSNAKSSCETDVSQRGQNTQNKEAEESTALEAVTRRQPVKTQQTEKT